MSSRTFMAPAKVNLCLHVLDRRADGYHELAMLMQPLTLHDRIRIRLCDERAVKVSCPGLELAANQENIAAKAARLLLAHVDSEQGVEIEIEKRIPAAAGLGGGSSDAAAVLKGLNEMLDLGLPNAELMTLGVRLGADVPFFIFGKTAWATGVGETLQAWPGLPPVWFVLVNPGVPVATAWVYQNLMLTDPGGVAKIPRFPERAQGLVPLLHNDLEQVTCQRYPVVDEIKQRLLVSGAIGALMSGSGPTVFGLFESYEVACAVARETAAETGWWATAASPL